MKFSAALVCALLAVALLAACGGSDDTITKEAYLERAEAICVTGDRDRQAALDATGKRQQKNGQKSADAATEELVDAVLPTLVRMTDELEALEEPDSGAEAATAMVSSLRRGIEKIEAAPTEVLNAPDPFADANKKATALGLQTCGEI